MKFNFKDRLSFSLEINVRPTGMNPAIVYSVEMETLSLDIKLLDEFEPYETSYGFKIKSVEKLSLERFPNAIGIGKKDFKANIYFENEQKAYIYAANLLLSIKEFCEKSPLWEAGLQEGC